MQWVSHINVRWIHHVRNNAWQIILIYLHGQVCAIPLTPQWFANDYNAQFIASAMLLIHFVWLSGSKTLCKTYQTEFCETWWNGGTWAKEELTKSCRRSESQRSSWNLVFLTLTMRDMAFGFGGSLHWTMTCILNISRQESSIVTKHSQCRNTITSMEIYPDTWSGCGCRFAEL